MVGVHLLGYEVWDVAQAKTALEQELRAQFFSTYTEEFSPTTIWNLPAEAQCPVRMWERYRERARFDALFAVATYRLKERRQSSQNFADTIGERDELTPIYVDVGQCGVQLWDTYVGTQAGVHQRRVAENAIRLYKAGDPCDVLQTQEGLSLAQFYQRFPFGLQVFHLVRPLGKTAYVAVMIFFVLIVAIPASWLWRRVRQRNRPATTPK